MKNNDRSFNACRAKPAIQPSVENCSYFGMPMSLDPHPCVERPKSPSLLEHSLEKTIDQNFRTMRLLPFQVGPNCIELNPCPPGILCRDACSSPFYECVFCDHQHTGLHCNSRRGEYHLNITFLSPASFVC